MYVCLYSQFLLRPCTHFRRGPTSISPCSALSVPCSPCLPPSCLIDVCICGWSRTNRGLISYSFLMRSVNQTCEERRRMWPSYHSQMSAGIQWVILVVDQTKSALTPQLREWAILPHGLDARSSASASFGKRYCHLPRIEPRDGYILLLPCTWL